MPHKTDVAIIGGGPIGLFAAFQAGVHDLSCKVIEALDSYGGQCSVLYPEKLIHDVPGCLNISAQKLVDNLHAQASRFETEIFYNEHVFSICESGGEFTLKTKSGLEIEAKSILITAGGGAFVFNKPDVENLADFEGKSVFYSVTHREIFRDSRVVIAGGGDSAVDWALNLSEIASKIYFVHRRKNFRAQESSLAELEALNLSGKVDFKIPFTVSSLSGNQGKLLNLTLQNFTNPKISEVLEADFFLPFFGLKAGSEDLLSWEIMEDLKVPVDALMQTKRHGIFSAGDICSYKGKTKLLVSGFHEAAVAMEAINARHIQHFGKDHLEFSYSTSRFV